MVLLGLITGILFQGLDLIGKVQARLLPNIQEQHKQLLQERWFRESVAGLSVGIQEGEIFSGTETAFQGISTSPLHAKEGAPESILWQLTFEGEQQVLKYSQPGQLTWNIWSFTSQLNQAKFAYLDRDGEWQTQWNMRGSDVNQAALPEAIALTFGTDNGSWLVARVVNDKRLSWWLTDNE